MIALDTDVFSDFAAGRPDYAERILAQPTGTVCLPAIAIEEFIRGRLDRIRVAEATNTPARLVAAYDQFVNTLAAIEPFPVLRFTDAASRQVAVWRALKLRVGTHDLRIAAICLVHGASLVTRNRRDFERVPGLAVQYWT